LIEMPLVAREWHLMAYSMASHWPLVISKVFK
jgi:hypothetical protein